MEDEVIKFTIRGKAPSKSNCYKIITLSNHASLAKTKQLREYEKMFFLQFPGEHRDKNLNHFFTLKGTVYYPANRADLDNSLKIILDCLEKVTKTIKNDNKCIEIHVKKGVDKLDPRIEMELVVHTNL